MDTGWQTWALGIAGVIIVALASVAYKLISRWGAMREQQDQIIEQKHELQAQRLADIADKTRMHADSLKEGRGTFTSHNIRISQVEQNKVDKDEFAKYCKLNDEAHLELRDSVTRTEESVDTIKEAMGGMSHKLDSTVETITRIVARVVDDRGGVGK